MQGTVKILGRNYFNHRTYRSYEGMEVFVIFGKKKRNTNGNKTLFNVGIITINELDDKLYDRWTDELIDAADNVGSTTSLLQADWDGEQLKILTKRFPQVDMNDSDLHDK